MMAYMRMFEVVDLDERERFTRMVKALDRVYIKHVNAKLKAGREQAQRKAKLGKGKRR